MKETEHEKIKRIYKELEKYPPKQLELAPYGYRLKRTTKPKLTSR